MIFNNLINVWSKYQYQAKITIEFGKKFWKISYWVKSAWRKWPIHFNWKHNLDEIMNFFERSNTKPQESIIYSVRWADFCFKKMVKVQLDFLPHFTPGRKLPIFANFQLCLFCQLFGPKHFSVWFAFDFN